MRNPLTKEVKGYPVYGWLILLLIIVITICAAYFDKMPKKCTPQGDCIEEY